MLTEIANAQQEYFSQTQNSGIVTFLVGKDGVVYQKDLGENTAETAVAIAEYNPDGWDVVLAPESNELPGAKRAKK